MSFRITDYEGAQATLRFLERFNIPRGMPDRELLGRITRAFSRLPYENITKILKHARSQNNVTDAFRLPEEVLEDHLEHGMGGTCFSLTFFLHHILSACGFQSQPVMADRSYGENTHCALVVSIDEVIYLVDPGFLLQDPVPLLAEDFRIKTTFNELHLIRFPSGSHWDVYTWHGRAQKWRYRLKAGPVSWEEFQKHWTASFNFPGMKSIIVTTVHEGGQVYLHDHHLRVIRNDKTQRGSLSPENLHRFENELRLNSCLVREAFDVIGLKADPKKERKGPFIRS